MCVDTNCVRNISIVLRICRRLNEALTPRKFDSSPGNGRHPFLAGNSLHIFFAVTFFSANIICR